MPTAVTERAEDESRKRRRTPADKPDQQKRSRKGDDDGRDRDGRRDRDRDNGKDRNKEKRRDDDYQRGDGSSRRNGGSPSGYRPSPTSTSKLGKNNGTISTTTAIGESRSKEELASELKSKELVYEAKMKIQERIKELGLPFQQPSTKAGSSAEKFKETILRPEEASAFTQLHMEKMQRINEMKGRISKGVQNLNLKTPALVLDAISNEKILPPSQQILTKWGSSMPPKLKQESMDIEEKKPIPLQKVEPDSSTGPTLEFQDPRLHLKSSTRQRRQFEFKKPGEYEKLAKIQRSKAKLEKLQSEIEKAAKQTGISSAVKLAIVTPSGLPETSTGEYIPEAEWWDEVVLGNGKGYVDVPSDEMAPMERYANTITDLVEHPIQLKPPDEPLQPQYLKACLTKKEQKKLRRQNRREALKEKAEKIRLGLEKPPDAKLKISNLMRVLGTDAIQDPTKMEAVVRKQMADRALKHVEDNTNRKLTREEKAAKAIRKVAEDTTLAVHVGLYKVKSLANPAKKFKVMMNAKQLQMTGVIILLEDINVIVMEGGPKQQKFYKNLLMNRIKWNEEIAGQRHVRKQAAVAEEGEEQQPQGERNECTLIWEGIVQKRAFNGEPRFIQATNHKHAREMLDKYGVAHYWDLCYSTTVLLNTEEK